MNCRTMVQALIPVLALNTALTCHAEILTVDDDGPADFNRIQEAIEFALPGDEILVQPGAYIEAIDFLGKAIAVRAVAGPMKTSIKAPPDADSPTVTFISKENAESILEGFKIGGGRGAIIDDPVFGPTLAGGGIYCFTSSPTISNCHMVGMTLEGHGAGMLVMRCNPEIRECWFIGNTAEGYGGAIYILDASNPRITGCLFEGNSALWGGGVACSVDCDPLLEECSFIANDAFNVGGGLYVRSRSDPKILDCLFDSNIQSGNPNSGGAGLTVYGSGNGGGPCNPVLERCHFTRHVADGRGGAVHAAYAGNVTMIDCELTQNSSRLEGGGIMVLGDPQAPTTATLVRCLLEGNRSDSRGGGLSALVATVTIEDCIITHNDLLPATGTGSGGGCLFEGSENSRIQGTTICENMPDQVDGPHIDGGGNQIGEVCGSTCPADINGDGVVDGADLTIVLGEWGPCPVPDDCPGDLTGDGLVDGADLTIVLGEWGACS
ncbi:MAG: right-handed parallel beta-helix repeat-containing protein [Phycisphaerales bacterium]|nr:right-handed parallel beta-helix repeat-containing protein [Phycisphaerales bacterium]